MDLKTANRELEKLDNEYNYWLKEKENLLSLVMPKASDVKEVVVDGGKRVDKLLKFVELEDEKQINETLEYIWKKKNNLMNWLDEELKILSKYEPLEQKIVKDRDEKRMKWKEISKAEGYCVKQCQRIYDKYKKRETGRRSY